MHISNTIPVPPTTIFRLPAIIPDRILRQDPRILGTDLAERMPRTIRKNLIVATKAEL